MVPQSGTQFVKVTAKKAGQTNIAVTYKGITAVHTVEVKETLEQKFPVINKMQQGPVKVKINKNTVDIKVYAYFFGESDVIIKDSNRTFKDLTIQEIKEWAGNYTVFGCDAKVNVDVIEVEFGTGDYVLFAMTDGSGRAMVTAGLQAWGPLTLGQVRLYTHHDKSKNVRTPIEVLATAKHEIGHVFGLNDAYGNTDEDPPGTRPDADPKDADTKTIMHEHWDNPPVRGKEIQMLLYAWNYKEMQCFQTYTEYKIFHYKRSKALDY